MVKCRAMSAVQRRLNLNETENPHACAWLDDDIRDVGLCYMFSASFMMNNEPVQGKPEIYSFLRGKRMYFIDKNTVL